MSLNNSFSLVLDDAIFATWTTRASPFVREKISVRALATSQRMRLLDSASIDFYLKIGLDNLRGKRKIILRRKWSESSKFGVKIETSRRELVVIFP